MSKHLSGARFFGLMAVLAVIASLYHVGLLLPLHHGISEQRMASAPRDASGQVVYIAIDKRSLDAVGVWPWPRSIHAKAIERLMAADVTDIAFDVDFSTPSREAEDVRLAEALETAGGSVILPTFLQPASVDPSDGNLVQSRPISRFADHAWVASVNVIPDIDGVVRTYMSGNLVEGQLVPSIGTMLSHRTEYDASSFAVDFSIDPRTVPTYSYADLLSGALGREELAGKSILIGAQALELHDQMVVPVRGVISGPMLQLIAAETLLQDRVLASLNDVQLYLLIVGVALVAMFAWRSTRLRHQLLFLLVIALFVEAVAFYLFSAHAIMLMSAPVLTVLVGAAIAHTAADADFKAWLVRLARQDKRNTQRILTQVFADSSDAILVIDEDGDIIEINNRFRLLFNIPEEIGVHIGDDGNLPAEINKLSVQAFDQARRNSTVSSQTGIVRIGAGDNAKFIDYSITPSKLSELSEQRSAEARERLFICITARDVTVEREQRVELERLSRQDSLTGAERRLEFSRNLQSQIDEQSGAGETTRILGLGLRRLKILNASLGREVGDGLLKSVVKRLQTLDMRIAGVARLDGDVFAMRLAGPLSDEEIAELCEKIRRELSLPFDLADQKLRIQCYLGTAGSDVQRPRNANRLINDLEASLEAARKNGGSLATFDPELEKRQQRARLIERVMDSALENDEFEVCYQPQVKAATGVPVGAEALVRWHHHDLGQIPPGQFIEIAEATGRIEALGRFVLTRACIDAASWPEDIQVSVNVSAVQFSSGSLVENVKHALRLSGLAPHRLDLEITESCFMSSTDELILQLKELKALGLSISLDDFGTGYSSFAYFGVFPVDKIKLDQAFVRDVQTSAVNRTILKSVQILADGMGVTLLCEGVETEEERQAVLELGCEEIQGYLFGKPQPASEIVAYLKNAESRQAA